MEKITVVGQTNFRGQHRPFGIYEDDRRRHLYIIGKTGVGKTTLIENMILQDVANGKGVALVDPHGDVAERVLESIPPERINDVIYFDPADVEHPIAFNVLEAVDPQYKYLIASGLVSSLKKIWADSWGPRLEYILRNTILALLDYPGSTMLGIMRLLADKEYRKKVVEKIQDPVVKSFWINEFANYNERFRSEAISPIQNKVGQFLSSAIIRNIVAQPKSTIDMNAVMNEGKILLMNVSKGRIGEDNSALLGAMLITKLQLAAMDRAKMPEEERRDFYLYVDEFQNFATESFATILSEARKYRLNLIIAHQYITQMEEEVRDAVFGNVGTLICFRIGAFDAEFLEAEFAPEFTPADLVNLDKYNAYIKLMINGVTSPPFSMQTIPPSSETFNSREKVIKVSRERYTNPRSVVEEKIARWSGLAFEEEGKAAGRDTYERPREQQRRRQEPPRQVQVNEAKLEDIVIKPKEEITDLAALLRGPQNESRPQNPQGGERKKRQTKSYPAVCSDCKKNTDVPFKPDPEKPVYCKECFEKRKAAGTLPRKEEKKPENVRQSTLQKPISPPSRPASAFTGPPPPPLPQ
ncbi:MAG: type IV secretion system DNA-binding domain-containing protein [Candidatus Andersenbacteria bacterium]|nr:type IV secretion system DNA-binding domain-containing protein [Candidatus Andersenbacteria bacterium]MBI3250312.1 type IV secretion system DNA-binding domain-containing protein [Candidatus Andersenbacteria bacterium]